MAGEWNEFATGFMWAVMAAAIIVSYFYKIEFQKSNGYLALKASFINERLIFWGLIAAAFVVRVWGFGETPAGFNQDGAMGAVDAKALADYGTDRFGMHMPVHFTAWGYGQMSVLLSYLMVPFIKIGGLNEVTARLPALIVSMAGLFALFGLIKRTYGCTAGLLVLFLAAINPWHIMQSRWALDCNMFPHFMIIGCYFLHLALDNKKMLYAAMMSFALCMYCYGIAFFTVPLFLFGVAVYALVRKLFSWKELAIAVVVYFFFAWPIWAVMVINFLRLETISTPFFTIPFFPDSVRSGDILFFSSDFLKQLDNNFSSMLKTLFTQGRDHPWNALDDFGTQYQFALPFVLVGIIFSASQIFARWRVEAERSDQKGFGSVIVVAGVIIGIWTGLIIASVNVNRINIAYYYLIISAGLGLLFLWRQFRPGFVAAVAAYILFFGLFCNHHFGKWSEEIGRYFFAGMGEALKEATEIDTPRYFITVNSQFNGARTVSEILTMFHHDIDARYFQGVAISELDGKLSSNTIAKNKYNLLYKDRYIYFDPKRYSVNSADNAVYVVRVNELRYFTQEFFEYQVFGRYALVTRKL